MTRHLITAALAVAFCAGLVWWGIGIGEGREKARSAVALAAQIETTKRMMRDVDTLAQTFEADRAVSAAGADRLAATVRGLRAALAARIARDTTAAGGGDGGPIARALEQCADRYSELAAVADGYANQLIALQGWAGVVAPRE
jgi:hypothetical protein